MKIAVITTSYANNYGALLQTYALQRYLTENLSEDVVALDYRPPWCRHPWAILSKPRTIKQFLANIYTLLHIKECIFIKKRAMANKSFIDNFIKLSEKTYTNEEELQECKDNFDCLICGSDQIWNVAMRADKMPHSVFFLQFAKGWDKVKKIAYAPSIADPIPKNALETFKQYISIFDALSVREIDDVKVVQKMTDKKVHHVLDPVFLLSREQWSDLASTPVINEKYILCYFLSYGTLSDKIVDKVRKITGYKVVNLNINQYDKFKSDKVIWDASAQDFVSLIKNAEFICTNSFHCTAFSIIFKKDFVVVNKGWASSRMRSLQTVFGLKNRFVSEDWLDRVTPEMLKVDYDLVEDKIIRKKEESIKYLKGALYGWED